MNEGDRVVHHADVHKVKCRFRDHGTVTGISIRNVGDIEFSFIEVTWDDGQKGRHVLANLKKCSC